MEAVVAELTGSDEFPLEEVEAEFGEEGAPSGVSEAGPLPFPLTWMARNNIHVSVD